MDVLALSRQVWLARGMDDILSVIERALCRKGLSASAASRLAVGNPALIKNMRAAGGRKRHNVEALMKLARVLDLELYFGPPRTAQPRAETPAGLAEMGFVTIPFHAAAAPEHRGPAPVALSEDLLRDLGVPADRLRFVPVPDAAMAPELPPGALALIDCGPPEGGGPGIWALRHRDRLRLARIERPSDKLMLLVHTNPDHPVIAISGLEAVTVEVLGRVVWVAMPAGQTAW